MLALCINLQILLKIRRKSLIIKSNEYLEIVKHKNINK